MVLQFLCLIGKIPQKHILGILPFTIIQMIQIFIFSPIMILGACPAMTGSKNYKKGYYYVNQERFDSFAQAKKFIRTKAREAKEGTICCG